MGNCYIDSWIFGTPLELRNENANNKFYVNVYEQISTGVIYPRQKLIPELKRTGYKKGFYGQRPMNLFAPCYPTTVRKPSLKRDIQACYRR